MVDVQLLGTSPDGWAHVVCSNGWECWTDLRALEVLHEGGRRGWLVGVLAGAGLLALVVAGVVVLVSRRAEPTGEAFTSPSPSTLPRPGTPLTPGLQPPSGWVASDDGLVVASAAGDLSAEFPMGPRVRIEKAPTNLAAERDKLARSIEPGGTNPGGDVWVGIDPAKTQIGGRNAVSIALVAVSPDGRKIVQGYLFVPLAKDDAVTFVLEAPIDQWESTKTQMASIPVIR